MEMLYAIGYFKISYLL